MKSELKKLDSNKMELNISVEGEIVKNKFEEVFKKIAAEAKIKGFRPGHAPRDILEKEFSGLAHEQVLKELIPDLYDQAVQKETLHVLDMPDISEVKLDRSSLSFRAQVEVTPEVGAKNYKGIKIEYKKVAVFPDEIKRNIDSIKESRKVDVLDDNFAKTLSYPNLAELEKAIERQMAAQKTGNLRQDIERQVIDGISKGLDFKAPQSLVAKQLEELVRQARVELALRGMPKENIIKQEETLRKELGPQAESQVRVYLILSDIAKKENIPVDDNMSQKVMEFLFKEAVWNIVEA
ncbi:MAG: trigger factor [Candidatus Omnitrophica bacterium]|nr:trigger factor [Candidatus Omnitrophota bacterium]